MRPARLTGPVDVCVGIPRLELDRPFTYLLRDEHDAGVGSLLSVPFHGRTVKGWVLGPPEDPPAGRLLPVRRVRSPVRFFDERMLRLLRWMSERYLAPLAAVIERSHPPRVASEERPGHGPAGRAERGGGPARTRAPAPAPARYRATQSLLAPGTTWLRPLPHEEAEVCVAAVRACVQTGRRALVLVPTAEPLPFTARSVLEALGPGAVAFMGGDGRDRYRTWLEIGAGKYRVVVGTRPAVFAPLPDLGLIWVGREVHPGHREERAPYYHVRDVAVARAGFEGAACVLSALCPSVETAVAASRGEVRVARPPRGIERAAAPLVEVAPPDAEDRSARLATVLREARSAALIVSRRGYGTARVCRRCGRPATCAACGGPIGVAEAGAACRVCGAAGRCAECAGEAFGVERGGTEHVARWAARTTGLAVHPEAPAGPSPPPGPGRVLVGTAAAVTDAGPLGLDLVALLDPDRALARPGLRAGEQAVATWMEAAAWARGRAEGGRVLLQTRHPGHPAVQAVVRWDPQPFLEGEARRRREAGFPPGHPVFRVAGRAGDATLRTLPGTAVLAATGDGDETICLVTVSPGALPAFRQHVVRLASEGMVARVEAEPHL